MCAAAQRIGFASDSIYRFIPIVDGAAMNDMQTPVWELIGMTGHEPGLLKLSKDVLSFETEQGVRFTCPVSQLAKK